MSSSLATRIASWRDGSAGFFKFLDDVKPQVRSHTGGWTAFELGPRERVEVARALDGEDVSVCCLVWPRRHGKTLTSAMIIVWRFMTRPNENIAVVANSERQVLSTAFKTIADTFQQTPALKALVKAGTINVLGDRIEMPATGSLIAAYSSNPGALWGKKLSCAQISEIHAAPKGDEVFAALAGSLLDTAGSLMLIDSTVSPKTSILWELYQAANHETDPDRSIAFSHIQYADLEDACRNAPPWLSATKLRSLSRQMLPQAFALLHLNRWGDASSALFPADVLAACVEEYPLDVDALTNGAAFVVGGGLDRAFGGSKHGDATVTVAVLKTIIDEDEHLFVLDADSVFLGRLSGIKQRFTNYHRDHGMRRLCLESYAAQDAADWASSQPFGGETEVVHPSRRTKYAAFTSLYQAAAEGRLHIHPKFKDLLSELATIEVHQDSAATDGEAAIPKFKHPRGKHDDYAHALAWAVYGMRATDLNPYEIEGIHCLHGRGAEIAHCVLNGGDHVPLCGKSCRSMKEAIRLFQAYQFRKPLVPVGFEEFVSDKLTNIGAHTLPR